VPIFNINFADKSGKISPNLILKALGPLIPVRVGPASASPVGKPISSPPEPLSSPPEKVVQALIDTGANASCIDIALADELKLPIIDRIPVSGVAGNNEHNVYLGLVVIPELNTFLKGRFIGVNLANNVPMIVGRDFLDGSIMIYNGSTGQVTISR
jgi:predicted aspartyl protease